MALVTPAVSNEPRATMPVLPVLKPLAWPPMTVLPIPPERPSQIVPNRSTTKL